MAKNDYILLSNFGVRYFLEAPTFGTDGKPNITATTAANELVGVTSASLGEITKDTKKYRTLNGNGWESVVPLGNSIADGNISLLRDGTGNPYVGTAGSTTYQLLKKWVEDATAAGGTTAEKFLVELVPRGGDVYEGTLYRVIPSKFAPGERNTDDGQLYSVTVSPFGPPYSLTVTYTAETDSFAVAVN